jgi:hypothetical protein
MSATTAGVLAFLGAVLGTIISYLVLFAFSSSRVNISLTAIPAKASSSLSWVCR